MRAFVQLRDLLASNKTLAHKLSELEHKLKNHHKAITTILSAICELLRSPVPKRRPMAPHSPSGTLVDEALSQDHCRCSCERFLTSHGMLITSATAE